MTYFIIDLIIYIFTPFKSYLILKNIKFKYIDFLVLVILLFSKYYLINIIIYLIELMIIKVIKFY